ncbi:hypothetical protein EON77_03225, partial [bacterium]
MASVRARVSRAPIVSNCTPIPSPRVHRDWALEEQLLGADDTARRIFLPKGRAPAIGEVHHQPELGAMLGRIARSGRS